MGSVVIPDKTFACAHGADADWQIALDRCLEQLEEISASRGEPDWTLGWLYLGEHYGEKAEVILNQLHLRLPGVAWVGAVGMGVASNGIEYIGVPAMVLMLAPLPREHFRIFSARQPILSDNFEPYTALVHADSSSADIDKLLLELSARTATGYLFGGLSSGRGHALHIAEGIFSGSLSGVAFGPGVGLVSRVTQGCRPIGPTRNVTRAERNYVVTLDDMPALDCILHDLGLPQEISDEALLKALASTLVGLVTTVEDVPLRRGQFGADTVVRHVIGVGRKNGLLAIADQVSAGMRLTFCERNAMVAQLDLARIATEIRNEIENDSQRKATGAVYVSCSGRGGPHFGAPHAELQMLQNILGDVPLVGFFASGEIARHHLYGYTGVLTVFMAQR